jgi:hypothetical protein
MKFLQLVVALYLGMLLYRVTVDGLTQGGRVDAFTGMQRLLFPTTNVRLEEFSPYYYPATYSPDGPTAMPYPKARDHVGEEIIRPSRTEHQTLRSAPNATMYPAFETSSDDAAVLPGALHPSYGTRLTDIAQ